MILRHAEVIGLLRFSKCGQGDEEGAQDGTGESDGSYSEEWLKHYDGCDLTRDLSECSSSECNISECSRVDAAEWVQQQ